MYRREFLGRVIPISASALSCVEKVLSSATRSSVFFTDLTRSKPAGAMSIRHQKGKWQALGYKTAEISGRMIYADPESEVPSLTFSLQLSGWHAVFIGLPPVEAPLAFVKLKLSSDRDFTIFQLNRSIGDALEEGFWTVADLTTQSLIIEQAGYGRESYAAGFAYLRCLPLTSAEVEDWRRATTHTDTKRLVAFNDGHGLFYLGITRSKEDLRMWMEPLRRGDFSHLVYGALDLDVAQFPARIATTFGSGISSFPTRGDRVFAEVLQDWARRGDNPLTVVRETAREIGLKLSLAVRMNYLKGPSYDELFGRFYWDNPDLALLDKNGEPGGISFGSRAVSYAHQVVQQRMREVIKELAQFEPDGIHLLFTRFPPFIGYEPAATELFRQRHHISPTEIPEDDLRWQEFKSEIMTNFVKAVRRDLDEVGRTKGKRLELSASVEGRERELLLTGIDPATWMKLGLIDWLVAFPYILGGETSPDGWQSIEAEKFMSWAKGTNCRVYFEMQGVSHAVGTKEARDWDKQARHFYSLGGHGLAFWDTDVALLEFMNRIRWLGHREDILSRRPVGLFDSVTRRKLTGISLERLRSQAEFEP